MTTLNIVIPVPRTDSQRHSRRNYLLVFSPAVSTSSTSLFFGQAQLLQIAAPKTRVRRPKTVTMKNLSAFCTDSIHFIKRPTATRSVVEARGPFLFPCPWAPQIPSRAPWTESVPTSSHTATLREWCTLPPGRTTTYVLNIHSAGTGPRANLTTFLSHIQEAIDIAQESFPELREVDRDRIGLEVRVVLSNQQERKKAEISRSAWSAVVTTLARFEIVEIRVGLPSNSAAASSSSTTSAVEPPPYASGTGWPSDVKGSQIPIVSNSPPISRSPSRTQSLANRFATLFTPKTS